MEHVRDMNSAHKEISRILKAGGNYIFTVPYDPQYRTHRTLIDTSGDKDVFLVAPHYHGDPLTGGVLAYRIFGNQIFEDLAKEGFSTEFFCLNERDYLIEDGDVFVSTKLGLRYS